MRIEHINRANVLTDECFNKPVQPKSLKQAADVQKFGEADKLALEGVMEGITDYKGTIPGAESFIAKMLRSIQKEGPDKGKPLTDNQIATNAIGVVLAGVPLDPCTLDTFSWGHMIPSLERRSRNCIWRVIFVQVSHRTSKMY